MIRCRCVDTTGAPLLENGSMNIKSPSIEDLADSLPTSWTGTVCQRDCGGDNPHPGEPWLASFWQMSSEQKWNGLPAYLTGFLLVPLSGNRLASAAFCTSQPALTSALLANACKFQPDAAQVLADIGCLCITEPQAEMVSTLSANQEPISLALQAAASKRGMPLQQLISEQHLGTDKYNRVCTILAHLSIPQNCEQRVQAFLRRCTVFEDITGAMLDLARRKEGAPKARVGTKHACSARLLPMDPRQVPLSI